MAKCEKVAIGIDLGTSVCTVGVLQNGQVEIVLNEGGKRVTPNCVAFTEAGRLVGEPAKAQEATNPENTIYDVKRLIGRSYYDKDIANDLNIWPFKVINFLGLPKVEVNCKCAEWRFTPEELSSMVLCKVKQMAEDFVGKPVQDAVIAVPTYFNAIQRQATKDAGTIAGLNVLRVINEPIAAALAYGFLQKEGKRHVLVFDLGGGTLDVSVFSIANGVFDLKATSGNTHLGGKNFDAVVTAYFVKEIKEKHGIDITSDKIILGKLQAACQQAKECLSVVDEATVCVECLPDGSSFVSSISRAKFEELNAHLFKCTLVSVQEVLSDANITKDKISEIFLVGGSTRIPKIQCLLKQFFNGKELTQTINPEEAVALGAAIEAARRSAELMKGVVICDAAPCSTGIKTAGGGMTVLIPQNTSLPYTYTQEFSTYTDNQSTALIEVFEGEKPVAEENFHLGDIELTGLPLVPRGTLIIEVTFTLDAAGMLGVTAQEKDAGRKSTVFLTRTSQILTSQTTVSGRTLVSQNLSGQTMAAQTRAAQNAGFCKAINELTNAIERCKKFYEEARSAVHARPCLENFCLNVLGCCNDQSPEEALKWLECNPAASKEEVQRQKEQVKEICSRALAVLCRVRDTPEREIIIPAILIPEADVPEIVVPEVAAPETVVTETIVPEVVVPETVVTETIVPEIIVPEPVAPKPAVPELAMLETTITQTPPPQVVVPETPDIDDIPKELHMSISVSSDSDSDSR